MKKLLTMIFLVAFAAWSSYGAVATGYLWSQNTTGTYTAVTGGTLVASGSGLDDGAYPAKPIGFTFYYNGVAYTQFGCDDNGFIQLGGGALSGSYNVIFSGAVNAIAAYSADLAAASASAELRYVLSGTAPNQVLTVQWSNFQRYANTGTTCNFQIKLYETTNSIEVCYGACAGSATEFLVQVGITGNPGTDVNNRGITAYDPNAWLLTVSAPSNNAMPVKNTWFPPSGLIFKWSAVAPGVAGNVSPAIGATGIAPTATLNWTAPVTGGVPDGYKLYFGTNNPPTNIVNGTNIGNVLTYDPTPDMALLTNYYWKVVPTNGGGDAAAAAVWNFQTTVGYGDLTGYVLNCYGVPVQGAVVAITGPVTATTTSGIDGKYTFLGISAGTYSVAAQKTGYNTVTIPGVVVPASSTANQNITLTQPAMTVLPNPNNVTVSPNELYNGAFAVTNQGCGQLTWTASIGSWSSANHSWFSMPTLTGIVAPSSNISATALFNASGLPVGTALSAVVTFTSNPDVGTLAVPVNMVVAGAALVPVTNLEGTLTDQLSGAVTLTWDCTPGTGFLYYTVKRGGTQIAVVPSATNFNDVLPTYGSYTYEVAAWYTDGQTAPASVVVEWPNPTMTWTPAALAATVWTGTSKIVPLTVGNTGLGTLAFGFPAYLGGGSGGLLSYCAAAATVEDEYISNVHIGSINNSSGWSGYANYTAMVTDLIIGAPTSITVSNGFAYSSDLIGVYIDYNHNGLFTDAGEFLQLTGNNPGVGTITVPGTALPGLTTMRVRMNYSVALAPCGSQTFGEVEDYAVNIKDLTFITAVAPAEGFVAGGGNQPVNTTFSATGTFAPAGVYISSLKLNSNDLAHASVNIPATMTVTVPGSIAGVVTDGVSGDVIPGVMVQAGIFTTMTDDNGAYVFPLDAGTYSVAFSKLGYQSVTVPAAIVVAGSVTTVNAQLFEQPYAPSCASATVNATDTQSTVTWCAPAGPYELLYDDGTAENFAAWQASGNMNAVKFTAKGYPAKVVGGKFFVGDGSFPAGGNFIGKQFAVEVYKADGASGMPGTRVDSTGVTVNSYGWINVAGLNATIASGDFYLVMVQLSVSPDCVPIGVDESLPKAYKSYSRNISTSSPWVLSPYQDFMMHAVVSGPMADDDNAVASLSVVPGKVPGMISQSSPRGGSGMEMNAMVTAPEGYDNMDIFHHYSLSRISLGAVSPVAPAAGVFTLLNNNITPTTYTEGGTTWSSLAQGWYAYGVKAVYPNAQESPFMYTNNVPHKLFADVTINVKLVCGFVPAEGALVTMTGIDYPFDVLTATVPASGTVFFDNVIKGKYQLLITIEGYYPFNISVTINSNRTIDAVLEDLRYTPRNLFVDDMTLVATWDPPLFVTLTEDFEGGTFPPAGWQETSSGAGWFSTTNGSSSFWPIPGHTKYAVTNDDGAGSTNNGCCDYLITPEMDLTGAPSFVLSFQSFFNPVFGGSAYVEMSTDAGLTWTQIETVADATTWQQINVDLAAYSGAGGLASVWFAFHYNDNGVWADGWAIDDVTIASGKAPTQGYGVFLDGTEVGQTSDVTWTYDPTSINYGQTYVAGVAGKYCSGYSELDTYTFTSHFLYPPRNLEAVENVSSTSGAAILTWDAPIGGDKMEGGINFEQYMSQNNLQPYNTTESSERGIAPSVNPNILPGVTLDLSTAMNSKAWGDDAINGSMVTFNLDTPGTLNVLGPENTDFMASADIVNGVYYGCVYGGKLVSMDTATGTFTTIGTTADVSGMAYDFTTSTMYGIGFDGTLYTIDLTTGATTVAASSQANLINLGCDNSGNLFAVDISANNFGSINKTTGAWTVIAPVGFDAAYAQDMTCDHSTNTMYWAAYNNTLGAGQLYIVDVTTGALTLVGNFQGNTELTGFAVGATSGGVNLSNLVAYKIYRDDAAIVQVPTTPREYWDMNLMPENYCYDISAIYDLTPYGPAFAGLFGESVKEGTACVDIMYGFDLPFAEDFTTGQFDVNLWTVGDNWIMDGQSGNPLPSAKFKWDPLLTDYASSLESFYMNATAVNTTTPYKIWLDYDLKLDDRTASTKELLSVEVWNGASWSKVKEYTNNGDFNWKAEHINISSGAKNNVFKVRFRANGDLSGDIFYWAVDNIHIYVGYEFLPPLNLVAASEGAPKNDIKLTWGAPVGGGTVMTYILDDNTIESGVYDGVEGWIGNEFAVTDAGVLQSASVYVFVHAGASATYSIDVFDGTKTLVGSSADFTPTYSDWTTVALPDVAFDGTFYVMIHYITSVASDAFGMDTDGPHAADDPEWYYDGAAWGKLSSIPGFSPCVIGVRATALVGGKKTAVTFNAGSAGTNYVSPGSSSLVQIPLNANTGSEVAHATYLGDNSEALTGYNVYRRAYAVFPAGQNTAAAGDWTKINSALIAPTEYFDMNLSNLVTNCYEYNVTAVYSEGESLPSNVDWDCIFVGVNPNEANEVKVYPNPATTYVRLDLTKAVSSFSIYNSIGSVVAEKIVKGETTITLNTSNYAAGTYNVKFTTNSGDSFSRKFVVIK